MIYFVILFCFFYVAVQFIFKQKIYRPSVLMLLVWGCVLTVHSFGAFNIPKASDGTISIIFFGLIAFVLGSTVAGLIKKRVVIGRYRFQTKQIRQSAFNVMIIIFFVLMLLPAFRAFSMLVRGASLYSIRYSLQGDILGTGVIAILFNYYCEPFLTFMIVYSVANVFSSTRKPKVMIATIIGLIFMTIISGGRFFILYFIGSLVIGFLLYRDTAKYASFSNGKVFRRVKWMILVAVVAIFAVTIIRGAQIAQTAYIYFSGGVPFLEHLNSSLVDRYTNGAATLYGFSRPIFVVFRKIGLMGLPAWLQNIENIFLAVDNPFFLAPGVLFNSFSTSFFAPYLDGGVVGVIVIYFILGYISEKAYRRIDRASEYTVAWYLLIALIIVLSFFRLVITHYSFALAFVYLFFMFKREKNSLE